MLNYSSIPYYCYILGEPLSLSNNAAIGAYVVLIETITYFLVMEYGNLNQFRIYS